MGRSQRDKGRRGAREALALLADRDWTVVESNSGKATEDAFALDASKRPVAVEVKHHACIRLDEFRRQAKDQARRHGVDWLLMCRIPGHPHTFYVEGSRVEPTVWR